MSETCPSRPSSETPHLEILPGDPDKGHCPTLLVDGQSWHDPIQPYAEVLPFEGLKPAVTALFGVGLGYTAAGIAQLAPETRIIAWEPLAGMADKARKLLESEWNLDGRAVVLEDLADFQARLIEACRGADSLATIGIEALVAAHPELASRFEEIVQQVVDAGTMSFAPVSVGESKWSRIAGSLPRIVDAPPLARLSGAWSGRQVFAVASMPDEASIARLVALAPRASVVTLPELAGPLRRAGIEPDLVVVGKSEGPGSELAEDLADSVLAITPDSDPAWWRTPAAGRLILGHTGTSFLLPQGDPGAVLSFRWGPEIPLVISAIALGASRVHTVGFTDSGDARWNYLAASRRRARVLERIASSSGSEVVTWSPGETPDFPSAPAIDLPALIERAAPLGVGHAHGAIRRCREAVYRLRSEELAYHARSHRETLETFLRQRAEGHAFTRSFIVESDRAPRPTAEAIDDALGYLAELAATLPPAPPVVAESSMAQELTDERVRIFLGSVPGEEMAARVLTHQIERLTKRPLQIRRLADELAGTLGPQARSLPRVLQTLLIPALCGYAGRAIYLEPNVCVLSDLSELWELPLGGLKALTPREGAPSVLLIDCAAARWEPDELLVSLESGVEGLARKLRPSIENAIGALPDDWSFRDELRLETKAMRYTCDPWLPWKCDLHPLRWVWEFMVVTSLEEGRISRSDFEGATREGLMRGEFVSFASDSDAATPSPASARTP